MFFGDDVRSRASCYDAAWITTSRHTATTPVGRACRSKTSLATATCRRSARAGPGGQCVNTTDSAVRMTHVPSGMTATSRESRSQFRNRQLCLQKLREPVRARGRAAEGAPRTKATRASKERRLAQKRRRSQTKAQRGRVDELYPLFYPLFLSPPYSCHTFPSSSLISFHSLLPPLTTLSSNHNSLQYISTNFLPLFPYSFFLSSTIFLFSSTLLLLPISILPSLLYSHPFFLQLFISFSTPSFIPQNLIPLPFLI